MILLQPDCLVFRTSDGENIPCSAQQVVIELIGDSAAYLDEEVIHNAAQAVLHYFKSELGQTLVSVGEFAQALERVLRGFGFDVRSPDQGKEPTHEKPDGQVASADLRHLALESGKAFELVFFPRLREELRSQLDRHPALVRLHGLRGCVKQLVGTRRWTSRCQHLNDQIVAFVRECLRGELRGGSCPVVME